MIVGLAIGGKVKTSVAIYLDINPDWIKSHRESLAATSEKSYDIVIRWDGVDRVLTWEQLVELVLKDGVKTDVFCREAT